MLAYAFTWARVGVTRAFLGGIPLAVSSQGALRGIVADPFSNPVASITGLVTMGPLAPLAVASIN